MDAETGARRLGTRQPTYSIDAAVLTGAVSALVGAFLVFGQGSLSALGSPLVGGTALLGAAGILAAWRRGWPAAYLVAGLAISLVPTLGMAHGSAQMGFVRLFDPLGGPDFVGRCLLLVALLLGLVGGVGGFLHARRQVAGRPARAWKVGLAVYSLVVVSLVTGALSAGAFATRSVGQAGSGYDFSMPEISGERVEIAMERFEFSPREFAVEAGVVVEVMVTNRDSTAHTFTYAKNGTEYNHDLPSQSSRSFLVYFGSPGSVPFRCLPHSSSYNDAQGMVGVMTVVAGAPAP